MPLDLRAKLVFVQLSTKLRQQHTLQVPLHLRHLLHPPLLLYDLFPQLLAQLAPLLVRLRLMSVRDHPVAREGHELLRPVCLSCEVEWHSVVSVKDLREG